MADITKCLGINCSKKESCYRYKAESSIHGQSWFFDSPLEEDGICSYYWPFKSKKELEQLNIENADWP